MTDRIPIRARIRLGRSATLVAALLLVTLASCSRSDGTGPKTAEIAVKGAKLRVELARTPDEQRRGLQEREELAEDAGMLFIFPRPEEQTFWMDKTLVPLSIAFLDETAVIVQIEDMEPMTRTEHRSSQAAAYALEVNRGWFARHNIKVGDWVDLSRVRAK